MVNKCCFYIMYIVGFVSFMFFLDEYLIPLSRISYYDEDICNITRVDYPINLPTIENTEDWIRCDCGRWCEGWSPCIRLFTDFNNEILIRNSFEEDGKDYTLGSTECHDGENMIETMKRLNDSINKAHTYINSSVNCFVNEDYTKIYLNIEFNINDYIAPLIIVMLSLCVCCCIFTVDILEKKRYQSIINEKGKINEKDKLLYHGNIY
jgi:hypothetical protein